MYSSCKSKRKRVNNIDDTTKLKIIEKMNQGYSGSVVGQMFGLKCGTVLRIYRKYKTGTEETTYFPIATNEKSILKDYLQRKGKSHRSYKFTVEQNQQIREWVDYDCTITLKQLTAIALVEWPELVSIHVSTIGKALKPFHYSFKYVYNYNTCWNFKNESLITEYRNLYVRNYINLKQANKIIFFLDEYGIKINSRESVEMVKKGNKGTICGRNRSRMRYLNYSIYMAISEESFYVNQIQFQSYNSNNYFDFVNKFCDKLEKHRLTGVFLVLDNVPVGKVEDMNNLIVKRGHIAIILPPFSLFLNPVDKLFSQWRDVIRRKEAKNQEELLLAILDAIKVVTEDNCRKAIYDMEQYINLI